jgi:hypothetical protein
MTLRAAGIRRALWMADARDSRGFQAEAIADGLATQVHDVGSTLAVVRRDADLQRAAEVIVGARLRLGSSRFDGAQRVLVDAGRPRRLRRAPHRRPRPRRARSARAVRAHRAPPRGPRRAHPAPRRRPRSRRQAPRWAALRCPRVRPRRASCRCLPRTRAPSRRGCPRRCSRSCPTPTTTTRSPSHGRPRSAPLRRCLAWTNPARSTSRPGSTSTWFTSTTRPTGASRSSGHAPRRASHRAR